MRAVATEVEEELRIEGDAALGLRVDLRHPALDAVRIELGVP
jgi:hypothetical protein